VGNSSILMPKDLHGEAIGSSRLRDTAGPGIVAMLLDFVPIIAVWVIPDPRNQSSMRVRPGEEKRDYSRF